MMAAPYILLQLIDTSTHALGPAAAIDRTCSSRLSDVDYRVEIACWKHVPVHTM